jgi:DNA-directed RNA polymerase subunit RPC12/RpoP
MTARAWAALAAIRRDKEAEAKAVKVCSKCGEEYSAGDLAELRDMGEAYNDRPFMCPDCYDTFRRRDLEDQLGSLIGKEAVDLSK